MGEPLPRPRLGFLGLGWIGRCRLEAIAESGLAEIVGLADPSPEACEAAAQIARGAATCSDLQQLLHLNPDGIVVATPNAQHACQCLRALRHGAAVFCQKPLARTAAEVETILSTAAACDRLLAVDFSYRHTRALQKVRELVLDGTLGKVFALELVFHNAYGPDKAWFNEPRAAGGGCLMDLGVHLVDFLHWTFEAPVRCATSHLFANGMRLSLPCSEVVEDFACAELELENGATARLACSWRLAAGVDARIEFAAYGSGGSAILRNVNGSFYDFTTDHCIGTRATRLCEPPDAWGGRAAVAWVRQLAEQGRAYDASAESALRVARTLDALYRRPC